MTMASSVVLDASKGVWIDGVQFPFHVSTDVTVEPGSHEDPTVVSLRIFVLGTVTFIDGKRRQVVDRELGDVGEWARALVRAGLLERLPWLAAS